MPTLSLGIADRAFELALRYSKEREQFGQPICNFPARAAPAGAHVRPPLQHAELRVRRRLAGRRCPHADRGHLRREALLLRGRDRRSRSRPIHILGGNGYMEEYEVERLDARTPS